MAVTSPKDKEKQPFVVSSHSLKINASSAENFCSNNLSLALAACRRETEQDFRLQKEERN